MFKYSKILLLILIIVSSTAFVHADLDVLGVNDYAGLPYTTTVDSHYNYIVDFSFRALEDPKKEVINIKSEAGRKYTKTLPREWYDMTVFCTVHYETSTDYDDYTFTIPCYSGEHIFVYADHYRWEYSKARWLTGVQVYTFELEFTTIFDWIAHITNAIARYTLLNPETRTHIFTDQDIISIAVPAT